MSSISSLSSCYLPRRCTPVQRRRRHTKPRTLTAMSVSDPAVLRVAEALEDSIVSNNSSPPLQKLRDVSAQTLLTTPWPSRQDEPFRFTDTSFIRNSEILPISPIKTQPLDSLAVSGETLLPGLVFVDGFLVDSLSNLDELPEGVFVGSLSKIDSDGLMNKVMNSMCGFEGNKDLFWSLNGVGANDVTVIYVPEGCKVERSLSLRFISLSGSDKESKTLPISNPRVLVLVENGGEVSIVEEYTNGDGTLSEEKCYWTNSVIEVIVGKEATVRHSYVQKQSFGAAHVKWTSVLQESKSAYELTEVSTGGRLSRHNVLVQQLGPDTITKLSTFHLSVGNQLQDLHSKLVLDHPRAYSRQIHKCIVAHSQGQAVFDGNVQVNRDAQQTDAGQLTRSLLLEPRATVNVKPNLQIVADDVRCSHGAAISDLEEDQLFYFRARGIDAETARKALIFSFAAEVVERFPDATVRKEVEGVIRSLLDPSK